MGHSTDSEKIEVVVAPNEQLHLLESIADKYSLTKINKGDIDSRLCFSNIGSFLSLEKNFSGVLVKLVVDFSSGKMKYRLEKGGGKQQPMARAIGATKNSNLQVLDATAGLGVDAFVMASFGCQLTMLEQSFVVYELLLDGLQRASDDVQVSHIVNRMNLINTNSVDYLKTTKEKFDVIYLDPMYPHRKKSAKVKKDMQILQYLLSEQNDGDLLFTQACLSDVKRVVVKRPLQADPLCAKSPTHSIFSKKTRFDVYLK